LVRGRGPSYPSPVTKRYPLEPLRRVRVEKLNGAERALGQAQRDLEEARGTLVHREREKADIDGESQRIREGEFERLARGELSASDLLRGAAWGVGAALRAQEKAHEIDEARAAVSSSQKTVETRQSSAMHAQADKQVVERDRDRFRRAEDAAAVEAEDEAAEETFLSRRHRGKS
jgi:hypothetical protein